LACGSGGAGTVLLRSSMLTLKYKDLCPILPNLVGSTSLGQARHDPSPALSSPPSCCRPPPRHRRKCSPLLHPTSGSLMKWRSLQAWLRPDRPYRPCPWARWLEGSPPTMAQVEAEGEDRPAAMVVPPKGRAVVTWPHPGDPGMARSGWTTSARPLGGASFRIGQL
jgi:hypothetical protein